MKKLKIFSFIFIALNAFIFTIDSIISTVDFLNFVGLPPLESFLIKTPLMNIDKVESKVGRLYYSKNIQRNLRYEHGDYILDCTGSRSGLVLPVDEYSNYYSFEYILDFFIYTRKEDFLTIGDNVCSDTLKLSLIVNKSNDSLLGIIKF